jgi:hypothetical protein
MFLFLNNVRVKVLKMFSTFYHNFDIRYNERSTKFVIFKLHLNFIQFYNLFATRSLS